MARRWSWNKYQKAARTFDSLIRKIFFFDFLYDRTQNMCFILTFIYYSEYVTPMYSNFDFGLSLYMQCLDFIRASESRRQINRLMQLFMLLRVFWLRVRLTEWMCVCLCVCYLWPFIDDSLKIQFSISFSPVDASAL